MANKVAEEMRERLAAALDTTGPLKRSRAGALTRLRHSLAELRTLGSHPAARDRVRPRLPGAQEHLAARFGLTPRECDVALRLAEGAPNAVIAHDLGISGHTARHHTRHILLKLELHSRAQAAAVLLHELAFYAAK